MQYKLGGNRWRLKIDAHSGQRTGYTSAMRKLRCQTVERMLESLEPKRQCRKTRSFARYSADCARHIHDSGERKARFSPVFGGVILD
jgi:hypothetical protein